MPSIRVGSTNTSIAFSDVRHIVECSGEAHSPADELGAIGHIIPQSVQVRTGAYEQPHGNSKTPSARLRAALSKVRKSLRAPCAQQNQARGHRTANLAADEPLRAPAAAA